MKLLKIVLLLSVLSLTGCLNEESCPYNTILIFRYNNDQKRDILLEKIDDVTVYVFSKGGQLVTSRVVSKPELAASQSTLFDLAPGEYRFVCWGNVHEHTLISDVQNLYTARLQHIGYVTSEPFTTNDHLYFGTRDLSMPKNDILSVEIDFVSAHINLEIYTKGIVGTPGALPEVKVHNLKPQYDFAMQPLGGATTYYPEVVYDSEREATAALLQTLRFDDDNPIIIEIKDPLDAGNTIASVNLADFMAENDISVNGVQEATVEMLIEFGDLGVTVTIPKWEIEDITPEGPGYN